MDFECIIYEKAEGIAIIKLNRPKVLNAMNKQLWLDFQAALEDVRNDLEIKVLIISGEGRAFSTGADLKESKDRNLEEYREYLVALAAARADEVAHVFDQPQGVDAHAVEHRLGVETRACSSNWWRCVACCAPPRCP